MGTNFYSINPLPNPALHNSIQQKAPNTQSLLYELKD